jgi:hypothetical protein
LKKEQKIIDAREKIMISDVHSPAEGTNIPIRQEKRSRIPK